MAINGLKNLYKNLSQLDLEKEQQIIINDNARYIADFQAIVLSEGKDKTGTKRDDQYRPVTMDLKTKYAQGIGKILDRVTFYMTGNLYKSLFARVSAKTFIVTSPLATYDKMIDRIGKENYGLDPQRKQLFRDEITIPALRKIIFNKTGLHLK